MSLFRIQECLAFTQTTQEETLYMHIKQIRTWSENDPLQSISKSAKKSKKIASSQITAHMFSEWSEPFDFPTRISAFPCKGLVPQISRGVCL